MAQLTLAAFVAFLRDKQLLTPTQGAELPQLQSQFPDVRGLARELVQRHWLTPYQANQLLQGNGADLVLGPYRFLERLGEGGMGQVFKARHVRMNRMVALKVIHKDFLGGHKAVERFTREARAAAQLSHPNIVLVHDADEVLDRHFLAMEHVEGMDLGKLVKQSGPLPVGQACEFARQATLGLQHTHERGIVHRDIKPSNLIVTPAASGAAPVVKILDFGLARFESETEGANKTRLTKIGQIMGTVDFIAPEQADNPRKADIRADIYSLGCTLFYLLTGQIPFPGGDMITKIAARLGEQPPSPRAYRPDIPPALESVMAKMMARHPGQRYQTPAEVAAALEPFAGVGAQGLTAARRPAKGMAEPPPDATEETDSSEAAAVQQIIRTAPRKQPVSLGRYWPWLAGGAAAVIVAVVVVLVVRNGSRPKTLDGPPVAAKGPRGDDRPKDSDKAKDTDPNQKKDKTDTAEKPAPLPKSFRNARGMEFVLVPKGKS
jgi:serine/threonine protein kinase